MKRIILAVSVIGIFSYGCDRKLTDANTENQQREEERIENTQENKDLGTSRGTGAPADSSLDQIEDEPMQQTDDVKSKFPDSERSPSDTPTGVSPEGEDIYEDIEEEY